MIAKITLDKIDLRNLQRSFITIAAALSEPRIFAINGLTDAWMMEEMKRLAIRFSQLSPSKKKRTMKFTVNDLTAIVMMEEKCELWLQLEDYIRFPIEQLNMMLMKEFINWRSLHNIKNNYAERTQYFID